MSGHIQGDDIGGGSAERPFSPPQRSASSPCAARSGSDHATVGDHATSLRTPHDTEDTQGDDKIIDRAFPHPVARRGSRITQFGHVLGKLHYCSPEHC